MAITIGSNQPVYQASGLASNMDTQGIIDKLVSIESIPLQTIQKQQAGITVQMSALAAISASLDSFNSVASGISTNGINAVSVAGTYSDFTISGAPSTPANYTVKVESLAHAAKARSTTTYANGDAIVTLTDQTLKMSVDGQEYDIDVKANTKLTDLVTQINASTSAHLPDNTAATLPFTASLVSDGTSSYITLTNKNAGFVPGQPATSALSVVSDIGLGLSSPLSLQATNAVVDVDGLQISRRTNTLTDVIPGVTLGLKNNSNTDNQLVFAPDGTQAASRVQALLNAYNKVIALVGTQVDSDTSSQNTGDKLGSSLALGIQYRMQQFLSMQVNSTGSIRSLHDLGVSLQKDGTLSLDSAALNAALAKDPDAANAVFNKPNTGLGQVISTYVKSQTDLFTGALTTRKNGLDATNKQLADQTDRINLHIEAYRAQLNIQFSALEAIMSGVNSTASFLDAQATAAKKG